MALHEQLRALVQTHGASILDQADVFRAALDDFLTEDEATVGEMNLLVDAVRLGSVRRLLSLLDQGAAPAAALDEAGAQLARDRDTDPTRARWALTMLGYALGRLDATIPAVVIDEGPPAPEAAPPPPPPPTVPVQSPAHTSGVSMSSTTGGGSTAGGRSRRVVLVVAAVLVLVVGGIVAAVAWPDGDDGDDLRSGGRAATTDADDGDGAEEPGGGEAGDGGVSTESCAAPDLPPVDPQADEAAWCLASQFDEWAAQGLMAVGQQVNLADDGWRSALDSLEPDRVKVIGFDFAELLDAEFAGSDRLPELIELGQQGYVLAASWHADNPWTEGGSWDLTNSDRIADLLGTESTTRAHQRFWTGWEMILDRVGALRDAGVPIILRPLHEANGGWFWWGHHDPGVFGELWAQMRGRADDRELHNILWHFSATPKTWRGIQDPVELLPEVDFAGLDTYDCEQPGNGAEYNECGGRGDYSEDMVELASYEKLAAQVPRMSLSEVGPQFSFDGSWDPNVVTTSVSEQGLLPAYALFWFDDKRSGRPQMLKQLGSLEGGPEWLATCPDGLCDVSGG